MDKKTWQAKSLFSSSAFSFQKTMINKPLPPSLLTMMTILKLKHNILFNATKAGDLATVRALRESGVDLFNSRQDDGTSSILLGALTGTSTSWTISSNKERIQMTKKTMVGHV
jgi:hypothetical protein